jgi:hypothetical protein
MSLAVMLFEEFLKMTLHPSFQPSLVSISYVISEERSKCEMLMMEDKC